MIGRILCALRIHDWEEYSMHSIGLAPSSGEVAHICVRCGKIRVWRFP